MRLTRRGRAVLVFVVAVLALGVLWLGTRAVSLAADGVVVPSHAGLPWVVVGQGDTLWSIADAVSPGDDADTVVREIMRINGLSSSLIHTGTRLYVPGGEIRLAE
ncbi:LysM peptidoglycan-binding domain-containing protein [Nonomuraea sp. NBC_01738]|uniref:LysM peptidoglycan-binding domain-containing protein n=1 Tax=Nonomuraea sp. NBC_01738 TaxID=2976003 RepID=UPI002E129F03|nr:LysM peptidoglycan-binding domain-containing protein [Nonomuraea sp. NBC_01738]